jgi:YD repeat-containing protein
VTRRKATSGDPAAPVLEHTYTYDLLGRQTSARLGTQNASTTAYNSLGWVLKEVDFDGTETLYTYNERGDVINRVKAGLTESVVYDTKGRIIKTTGEDATTIDYVYDNLDRVTKETHKILSNSTLHKNITHLYEADMPRNMHVVLTCDRVTET